MVDRTSLSRFDCAFVGGMTDGSDLIRLLIEDALGVTQVGERIWLEI
jgi:hypothetical protein